MTKQIERNKKLLQNKRVKNWRYVMELYRSTYKELDQALQQRGISIARFEVLLNLYFSDGKTPVELSRDGFTSRANVTTFLQRMEKDSLVTKEILNGSSKRFVYYLSDEGIELFETIFPEHIERIKKTVPVNLSV